MTVKTKELRDAPDLVELEKNQVGHVHELTFDAGAAHDLLELPTGDYSAARNERLEFAEKESGRKPNGMVLW